jgi:hypothetical protein
MKESRREVRDEKEVDERWDSLEHLSDWSLVLSRKAGARQPIDAVPFPRYLTNLAILLASRGTVNTTVARAHIRKCRKG